MLDTNFKVSRSLPLLDTLVSIKFFTIWARILSIDLHASADFYQDPFQNVNILLDILFQNFDYL